MNSSHNFSLTSASCWILLKYQELELVLENHTQDFEIAHSIDGIYKFLWDFYADWYVEYLKTDSGQIPFAKELFKQFTITASPYMPFETEALWKEFFNESSLLAFEMKNQNWTSGLIELQGGHQEIEKQALNFTILIEFIQNVRSLRGLFAIDPASKLEIYTQTELLLEHAKFIEQAGRTNITSEGQPKAYLIDTAGYSYSLDILEYLPDKPKEISRTKKTIESLEKQIQSLRSQLNNQDFIDKAGPEVVGDKQISLTQRENEHNQQLEKLRYMEK